MKLIPAMAITRRTKPGVPGLGGGGLLARCRLELFAGTGCCRLERNMFMSFIHYH